MLITLFLSDKIYYFKLPTEVSGSFSFYPNNAEEKLINVEAIDGTWKFYSTSYSEIISNGMTVDTIDLVPNSFYVLKKDNVSYLVYVSDYTLKNAIAYSYDDKLSLTVSNKEGSGIVYNCPCINETEYKFARTEKGISVNKSGKALIYINNIGYKNENCMVNFGDTVNLYGLKIIFMETMIIILNIPDKVRINESSCHITKQEFTTPLELDDYEIKEMPLYQPQDYYSKTPRLRRQIEKKEFKLSPPPKTNTGGKSPMLLVIGPMLTMGLVSFVMVYSTFASIAQKKTTLSQSWLQILSSIAMLCTMLVWPMISQWYTKRVEKRSKLNLITKYKNYLLSKERELIEEVNSQKVILQENLITLNDCINLIQHRGIGFWSKRIDQNDFLQVRTGIGDERLNIYVSYNEEDFTIEETALKKEADLLVSKYSKISDVPIGYSFYENKTTALIGQYDVSINFLNFVVLQLLTFYSYEDLKFVVFTSKEKEKNLSYMKYLNHNFTNDKMFRFFASTPDSIRTVCEVLQQELAVRMNSEEQVRKPHYFIIIDGYDLVKRAEVIKEITELDQNYGFNVVILESKMSKLPSKCNNFIILSETNCEILKNSYENQSQTSFINESNFKINMLHYAKILSNIPIEFEDGVSEIPDMVTFMEMEKIGKVEQLNILNRWNTNDSTQSLRTEIGVDEQNEIMYLDLHEKYHGPHGLIAGMTGSGKSEFIITYILSMCINYSPDDVSFILIDYKGGGLTGAFSNKTLGLELPHLVGTITNLDKAELDRSLVSISSEIKRRQIVFNNARDALGESTMDIYKYQRFYKEGYLDEPVPHLFIICDEFAELKVQQPEFIDNLISVARIGRSLGVHLILATQKPTGVVNDQIWSNSKFRVSLKVQDESDSRELLKSPDAAYITQTGRFFLQVGNNEYFALGQSAWCGAKYFPADKIQKQVDRSVDVINDFGYKIKSIQASNGQMVEADGDQVTAILKSIISVADSLGKRANKLWLENIPETILVDELFEKYNFEIKPNEYIALLGEYDAPEEQMQGLVTYNLLKDGNTIIMGNDGSEREKALNALIYSTSRCYSPEEVVYYIIDYGSEQLYQFKDLPHIGGIVTSGSEDKLKSLFKMIRSETNRRKKLFANYGGSYESYINSNPSEKVPINIIIVNNYSSLFDSNQYVYDVFPDLVRDSYRYGILFVFTCDAPNSVPNRVSQNCDNIIAYNLKEDYGFTSAFNERVKIVPRDIFGRGLTKVNGVHEFQTASIVPPEQNQSDYLREYIKQFEGINVHVKHIPEVPEVVTFDDVKNKLTGINSIPIGISKEDISVETYDFKANKSCLILSNRITDTTYFVRSLIEEFKVLNQNIIVIDPFNFFEGINIQNYYNSNFDVVCDKLTTYLRQNAINEDIYIVINSISTLLQKVSDASKVNNLLDTIRTNDYIHLIVIDANGKIKQLSFEQWFISLIGNNNGIWIGRGITDSGVIRIANTNKDMQNNYNKYMGYLVIDNYASLVKFIDFYHEEGDIDE